MNSKKHTKIGLILLCLSLLILPACQNHTPPLEPNLKTDKGRVEKEFNTRVQKENYYIQAETYEIFGPGEFRDTTIIDPDPVLAITFKIRNDNQQIPIIPASSWISVTDAHQEINGEVKTLEYIPNIIIPRKYEGLIENNSQELAPGQSTRVTFIYRLHDPNKPINIDFYQNAVNKETPLGGFVITPNPNEDRTK